MPSTSAATRAIFAPLLISSLLFTSACQPITPRHDDSGMQAVTGALALGDLEAARIALDQLIFEGSLQESAEALAAGQPANALSATDDALEILPGNPRALEARATAAIALADQMIVDGQGGIYIEGALGDALDAFRALPASCSVLTRASAVSVRLGNNDQALALARGAMSMLPDEADKVTAEAHRAWGQAAMRAFIAQTLSNQGNGGTDLGLDADELFAEAEDALMRTTGFLPDERDPWIDLSVLYRWRGETQRAIETQMVAIERLPGDRALLDALIETANGLGPGAAQQQLEKLDARLPINAYYVARQQLLEVIPFQVEDPGYALSNATDAELALAKVAQAGDAELAQEILGWRVIAQATIGWSHYNKSEFGPAGAAFLKTEELLPGGIAWQLDTRVRSAADGLFFIGDQFRQRGDWLSAAKVFFELERVQPDFTNWAHNAGFFARDAAVEIEAQAQALCRAATGELADDRLLEELRALVKITADNAGTQTERDAFHAAAKSRFAQAWKLAEQSYTSYLHASSLSPEDVRTINDTALMQVYYLHDNIDLAEETLLRAIKLGAEQLAADSNAAPEDALDSEGRRALTEAYGDALQNMGVLKILWRGDNQAAVPYLKQSEAVGPLPRPLITDGLLPWCASELELPIEAILTSAKWCQPCDAAQTTND